MMPMSPSQWFTQPDPLADPLQRSPSLHSEHIPKTSIATDSMSSFSHKHYPYNMVNYARGDLGSSRILYNPWILLHCSKLANHWVLVYVIVARASYRKRREVEFCRGRRITFHLVALNFHEGPAHPTPCSIWSFARSCYDPSDWFVIRNEVNLIEGIQRL